jgi:uncharacterized protein (UPF0276 family)
MVSIGTTYYGHDPALLDVILPRVDFIEVSPDSISRLERGRPTIGADVLDELRAIAKSARIIAHGTGLSIGSADGWCNDYLTLTDLLFSTVDVPFHSEHLGFTMVGGRDTGTMLVLPRVEAAVELIVERVQEIQERFRVPFLLENIANLFPEHPRQDYSPAGFLNEITRRSGCGLLLDVYNLECDVWNQRIDLDAFLNELDFRTVREIHIANGIVHRGLMLDVHSRATRPETLSIADQVLRRATAAEVLLFEMLPQAVAANGRDAVAAELDMLRARYAREH